MAGTITYILFGTRATNTNLYSIYRVLRVNFVNMSFGRLGRERVCTTSHAKNEPLLTLPADPQDRARLVGVPSTLPVTDVLDHADL